MHGIGLGEQILWTSSLTLCDSVKVILQSCWHFPSISLFSDYIDYFQGQCIAMAMFADVWKHKFQMFLLPSFPSLQSTWKMVSMNNFQWFCKIVFSSLFVFFWNCEETISNFVPAIVVCFESTFRSTEVHPQLRFLLLLLISETDPVEIRSDPDQQTLLTRFLLIKLKF